MQRGEHSQSFRSGIDKLTPNGRNARIHWRKQIRQIADSIEAFPPSSERHDRLCRSDCYPHLPPHGDKR
jgi:hypothetical protein